MSAEAGSPVGTYFESATVRVRSSPIPGQTPTSTVLLLAPWPKPLGLPPHLEPRCNIGRVVAIDLRADPMVARN